MNVNGFLGNSRFTKRTYLMNVYGSKGVIKESGLSYDSTTVWLLTPHRNPGGSFGLGHESLKWGDSSNYEKLKHLNLLSTGPILVDVELEEVLQGSGDRERKVSVVHNLRIVQPDEVEGQRPAKKLS